uniref:Uncharacterized protein n=1 Tax=Anguilla anguilla TaxID=7936 RepID=A0A0E9WR93_ANGAN
MVHQQAPFPLSRGSLPYTLLQDHSAPLSLTAFPSLKSCLVLSPPSLSHASLLASGGISSPPQAGPLSNCLSQTCYIEHQYALNLPLAPSMVLTFVVNVRINFYYWLSHSPQRFSFPKR